MKKHYPKKTNFTLAVFTVCFMLLVLAPSSTSLAGGPVKGVVVYIVEEPAAVGPITTNTQLVGNSNGTYSVLARYGSIEGYEPGRHSVKAVALYPIVNGQTGTVSLRAQLIVYPNGSALLIGVATGS